MADVSVLIVTWNSREFIAECLRSIYSFTRRYSVEVLVADNASNDDTVAIIRHEFPQVQIIETGANLGFAPAMNLALQRASGRLLCLLNPDACLLSDAIDTLGHFLDTHPGAGCCGPQIFSHADAASGGRPFPSLLGALFGQVGLQRMFPHSPLFAGTVLGEPDSRSAYRVPCLSGACMMVPRAVLEAIGHLDEELPMYFEDLDFCARLAARGWHLYCVPSAQMQHLGGESSALSPARLVLFTMEVGQAPWLYFRRHVGRLSAVAFSTIVLFGSICRLLVLLLASPLLALKSAGMRARVRTLRMQAWALLTWSLSRKSRFPKQLAGIFATASNEREHASGPTELPTTENQSLRRSTHLTTYHSE